MFMLDQWEKLQADPATDQDTLSAARELADEMCSTIFDRMGFSVVNDGKSLTVAGRGLSYIFPLRGKNVPLKYDNHNKGRGKKSGLPG